MRTLIRGIAKELDIPVPEAVVVKPEDIHFFGLPLQILVTIVSSGTLITVYRR